MPPWRRRRLEPDKRLDWRDPDMPVYREYFELDALGNIITSFGLMLVRPEIVSAEHRANLKLSDVPSWKRDPSYHWAELAKIEWEEPDDDPLPTGTP